MANEPALPDRQSIRLKGYDYSSRGCYFITVCVSQRRLLLGAILKNKMVPNQLGRIVLECWHDLPNHYAGVGLDCFVLMPNHLHGILVLTNPHRAGLKPAPTRLSEVVRGFKTFSAKRMNRLRGITGQPVWQRGYFEHIIRTVRAHDRIREYIFTNPERWAYDHENPYSSDPVDTDLAIVGAGL